MAKSILYTGTGDSGETSLIGGVRTSKDSLRLEAYGTLDEFSSFLGCVLSSADCPEEQRNNLLEVQNMLFNLGCYLATPDSTPDKDVYGLKESDIQKVESWTDSLDESTPPVRAFILPGGTPLAAQTHVARAVCRRAERRIITLSKTEYVNPVLIKYMNRLSDYLFILARHFNHLAGVEDIIWRKD